MGSLVLTTLSVFLGMFFVFMGSIKLSQQINREMHREVRRQFVRYAKVVPFATALGLKVSPKHYRLFIGWLELIAGLSLAFIPGRVKQLSNVLLILMTFGGIYSHYMIGDKFESKLSLICSLKELKIYIVIGIAPLIVFTLMLSCRLIISFQVKRREEALQKSVTTSEEEKKEN